MDKHKILALAAYVYQDLVKPVTIYNVTANVYLEGQWNSVSGRTMPPHKHVWCIVKKATLGFIIGVTFPIGMPLQMAYVLSSNPN